MPRGCPVETRSVTEGIRLFSSLAVGAATPSHKGDAERRPTMWHDAPRRVSDTTTDCATLDAPENAIATEGQASKVVHHAEYHAGHHTADDIRDTECRATLSGDHIPILRDSVGLGW